MPRVVIDASVVASWFMPDEINGMHEDVLDHIDRITIHVPSIFEPELINILLNAHKRKRIDQAKALEILDIVCHYPISVESSQVLLKESLRIFELAQIYGPTAYDAAYLELALRLNEPLITYDKSLLHTAKKLKLKTFI